MEHELGQVLRRLGKEAELLNYFRWLCRSHSLGDLADDCFQEVLARIAKRHLTFAD